MLGKRNSYMSLCLKHFSTLEHLKTNTTSNSQKVFHINYNPDMDHNFIERKLNMFRM